MGFRNTMGPSSNLQVKADGREKQKTKTILERAKKIFKKDFRKFLKQA
jgi:hypothetical protein